MPKLTDTQALILSRASQRDDRIALPLPSRLRGAAARKVVAPLIERGLLVEIDADPRKRGALWRQRQDGSFATLAITDAGLKAIGIEIDPPRPEPVADPVPKPQAQRKGTKQAKLIEMLRTKDGATLDEIVATTGWLKHTARGVISGQLKKRLGLNVVTEADPQRGRVYRITD